MKRDIRVSVLLFKEDKLLVVNMKNDKSSIYVLPGGGLEKEESILETGIREVKEETNLDIKILKIAYIKELYKNNEEAIDIILLGEIIGGKLKKGYDPEKKINKLNKICWVGTEELNLLNFHPKQLKVRLWQDFKDNFKASPIYLGRYEYPEE